MLLTLESVYNKIQSKGYNSEDYIHNGMYINKIVKSKDTIGDYTVLYSTGDVSTLNRFTKIQVVSNSD